MSAVQTGNVRYTEESVLKASLATDSTEQVSGGVVDTGASAFEVAELQADEIRTFVGSKEPVIRENPVRTDLTGRLHHDYRLAA